MISKTELLKHIQKLPEKIAIEELIEQLIFIEKLENRIAESKENLIVSEEDLKREMTEWSK